MPSFMITMCSIFDPFNGINLHTVVNTVYAINYNATLYIS